MSSKQIARAAVLGHRVNFKTSVETISGYVVHMDDYHWLVAVPDLRAHEDGTISLHLIHKGLTPLVSIASKPSLDLITDQSIKDEITKVGRGFWLFCAGFYLGQTAPEESS